MEVRSEFEVKLIGLLSNSSFGYSTANIKLMKKHFDACFKETGVIEIEWLKTGMAPRAAYENQVYQMEAKVVVVEADNFRESGQIFSDFIVRISRRMRGMMHDQVFVEANKLKALFPSIVSNHNHTRISGIALGNCPNPGVFLIRGDFLDPESHTNFARFEHDKRALSLFFGVKVSELAEHAGFRLNVYYHQILKVVVDFSQESSNCLYIQMKNPPWLWEGFSDNLRVNLELCNDWMRVFTWPADSEHRSIGCSPDAFAQSSWLRISFNKDQNDTLFVRAPFLVEIVSRIAARSSAKIHFGSVFAFRKKLAPTPNIRSLGSFRADYALQALITRGSLFIDQLSDSTENTEKEVEPLFIMLVRRAMKECRHAAEESLEQLLNAIDEKRELEILTAFWTLYTARKSQYERLMSGGTLQEAGLAKPLPKNCVAVAKMIVTPSRVLLMAPEVMMVNRVVRRFGADYALRCVFREDHLGKLAIREFASKIGITSQNSVIQSIHRTLSHGVTIADRHYSFLGWSNSQMRDQGCYLYAPRTDPLTGVLSGTVEEIRAWMGDFRTSVSVPKMMSRMGQCFTQAQPTIRLKRKHWLVEKDIEGGIGGKFCFSDGCGRISVRVARQIADLLELKEVPACFQVRFKGFKGILVMDPMIDEIINMPKIIFRKSQQKFGDGTGDDDYLEVVKYAMPSPVCLNRPFLTVLDQVSAKQSASSHTRITNRIHYYLERELCSLSNMLLNEHQACEELVNRTALTIDWIFASRRAGFELTVDPFVRQMLFSIYRYNIVHHISKAKIFLPPSVGRSMYGVVDETGLLQHGQVFIQYSPSIRHTSNKPTLLTGKVLITKNPCLVPGDVRVFEAVWQPSLCHLVDVVVFPQHGPRPHPDEMAGSDLDGDEYSVIWDPEMLLEHNEPAMVYPSGVTVEDEKEPTTEDMVDFFVKYLQQDSIGRMSHAHLAYADLHGLFHKNCHSIALKCAVAVDFPKSGVPAEPLTRYEICTMAPDFMVSGIKPTYYSHRLNGQLYRKARKVEEVLEELTSHRAAFETEYDRLICPDDVDVFFGDEVKLFRTISLRDEYAARLQQLLDEYGIEDEASIVSGHATSIKRLAGWEKDDYSFYHTDKVVELRYQKLFQVYRAKFFEEFGGEAGYLVDDGKAVRVASTVAMQEKARQWYFVAYVQAKKSSSGRMIGHSFPWIAWEALCDLRRQLMVNGESDFHRVKYLLASRLSIEMSQSTIRNAEKFEKFKLLVKTHRDAHCIRRYSEFYSSQLIELLFVLSTWLHRENVLPSSSLSIWHVGRLLIRFALGELHGNPTIDFEKSALHTQPVFSTWLSKRATEEEPVLLELDTGSLMIEFLRYLASQSFALSAHIPLRVFSDKGIEPSLLRNSQWLPLHHVAYRTFHSVAVSGLFGALHLGDEEEEGTENEGAEPLLVEGKLFSKGEGVESEEIVKTLKKWSGVTEIMYRTAPSSRKARELVYVSSIGTVLARQRLARLLLLSEETLRDAIRSGVMPVQIRDDCL